MFDDQQNGNWPSIKPLPNTFTWRLHQTSKNSRTSKSQIPKSKHQQTRNPNIQSLKSCLDIKLAHIRLHPKTNNEHEQSYVLKPYLCLFEGRLKNAPPSLHIHYGFIFIDEGGFGFFFSIRPHIQSHFGSRRILPPRTAGAKSKGHAPM